MIGYIILATYFTIAVAVGRHCFQVMRPNREPDCEPPCGVSRHHRQNCWRRMRKDRSHWPWDHDVEAFWASLACGLFWWMMAVYVLMTCRPPATETEAREALKEAERKLAEQEKELGIGDS